MTQPTAEDVLSGAAARFPDRTAIYEPATGDRLTFAELDGRARQVAAGLADLGLEPGDRLSATIGDSIEFLELLFGSFHAGLVFNPISYRAPSERLAYVISDAASSALVYDDVTAETVASLDTLPETTIAVDPDAEPVEGSRAYADLVAERVQTPDVSESDPAILMYTSGTTGQPKGVLHSHRTVVAAALVSLPYNRLRPTDVNLSLGPLYHVGPLLCNVLPATNVGASNVIAHGFDAESTLESIESAEITTMWGVPTHVRALVDAPSIDDRELSHVRMIQYSGSAMPAAVARQAGEHLPNCEFVNAYGSTEIVFGTLLFPEFHEEKLGSIGHAAPNAEVRVVDPEEPVPEATLGPGEVGELLVKASTCMLEYWRDPAATEAAMAGGWFRTGDLARRDEDGFLYFVDRKDDMIVTGGENVYPAEVEELLHDHPDVAAAAVVGVPDEQWGEVVTAAVVPAGEELSTDELDTFFRESEAIESFKRPRRYVLRERLPQTASDKIDRRALLESLSESSTHD